MRWRWLIAIIAGSLTNSICAQTAERPQWKVGDTWLYHEKSGLPTTESDWSRKVVASLAEGRFTVEGANGTQLTFDGEGNSLDKRGPEYSWRRFNFPLSVGKHWNHERKIAGDTWNGNENSSWVVKAYEKVTVPAGTFDCFRVEGVTWRVWTNAMTLHPELLVAQIDTTFWYCPEVKWAAKWKTHSQANKLSPFIDGESVLTSFVAGR